MNARRNPSVDRPSFVPLSIAIAHCCKNETDARDFDRFAQRGGIRPEARDNPAHLKGNLALTSVDHTPERMVPLMRLSRAHGGATDGPTPLPLVSLAASANHWIAGALENLATPNSGALTLAAEYIRSAEKELAQLREGIEFEIARSRA